MFWNKNIPEKYGRYIKLCHGKTHFPVSKKIWRDNYNAYNLPNVQVEKIMFKMKEK